MNSLVILAIAISCFVIGYHVYARKLAQLWDVDSKKPTPAITKFDGVDYVPARHWLMLFGHHFASIAGAGPIIGPVIALTLWGWLPALIWVIVGTIFIGGVHDFGNLITSVREGGTSIADIASQAISRRAKTIFSLFIWLALVLVIAVFAYLCADTFIKDPKIVIPSLGLIPIAILTGIMLYRLRWNPVAVTILGLSLLAGLIVLGQRYPITFIQNQSMWIVILLLYAFIASIIPVNILLQPRDYLASFLLFFGLLFGFLGLVIMHPTIKTPAFVQFNSSGGSLWPMLSVVVACGAISGFHSLIASGTTSKQLPSEQFAKRIGYGGMVTEGLLAVMVILVVSAGLSMSELSQCITDKINPIGIYAIGYGNITKVVLGGVGGFIGVIILNAFILTTLDSATRITRYITEEFFRIKNRFLSTSIVVLAGGYLALSKDSLNTPLWKKMWPAFGASNQLVAALALLVLSCWLLAHKKPTRFTLLPAIFMLITTVAALFYQTTQYVRSNDYPLIIVSVVLLGLTIFLVREVYVAMRRMRAYA
ncbi:carbon starvation protein A [Candidatus Omnitrophota bacterium]